VADLGDLELRRVGQAAVRVADRERRGLLEHDPVGLELDVVARIPGRDLRLDRYRRAERARRDRQPRRAECDDAACRADGLSDHSDQDRRAGVDAPVPTAPSPPPPTPPPPPPSAPPPAGRPPAADRTGPPRPAPAPKKGTETTPTP